MMTYDAGITPVFETHDFVVAINQLMQQVHRDNVKVGWWTDAKTGASLLGKDEFGRDRRNVPEMLALMHSELSEGLEGYRKNLKDDHLPHRDMLEVELADTIIRIFDLAGSRDYDLGGAILEKLAYNRERQDHKMENRQKTGGKSC